MSSPFGPRMTRGPCRPRHNFDGTHLVPYSGPSAAHLAASTA